MRTLLAALALILFPIVAMPAEPAHFAGDWAGTLDVGGGQKLGFILHLVNTNGTWSGTADSPDQGRGAIPISKVSVEGAKLSFEIPEVNGEYEGTLDKDGKTIMGTWWQNGMALTLNFTRGDAGPTKGPNEPKPPLSSRGGEVAAASPGHFAGDWAGGLDAGTKLRLVVHLIHKDGVWTGSMDSIDQGANGIAFSSVTVDGDKLHIEVASIGGQYDGTLSADQQSVAGTWKQSGMSFPLDLKRGDESTLKPPNRPQEPKAPFPYRSEDVTVPGPGGITLAGTLTMPEGEGPFPAVLLISGSGAQDRDESVFGHRPFLVLADHLTRAGLAVLRLDDRGFLKSTGNAETATTEDFAQDALAEVAFLKSRKGIDGKRIGLVGHSEGGIIAPMVAARSKDVSFIVLMAGVGVPAEHLLVRQSEDIMKASGVPGFVIEMNSRATRRMFTIVSTEKDSTAMRVKLDAVADSMVAQLTAMDPGAGQMSKQALERSVEMVASPWFRYLLTLDPVELLKRVKVPVLAINGSLDLQVSAKENLPAIEKALRAGGNKDVTATELPGLNHLFQTASTGAPMEYANIEETMAPAAMKTVSDWILVRVRAKK